MVRGPDIINLCGWEGSRGDMVVELMDLKVVHIEKTKNIIQ